MPTQTLDRAMNYFRAKNQGGQEFYRASRYENMTCAVVIYPLEDGGGLFPTTQVDWYSSQKQAERHAEDWRKFGHHVEVVCAETISEGEYHC
jgi:hypothetical protein